MPTVNIQENPISSFAGSRDADAVIIDSDIVTNRLVAYQIEKLVSGEVITINSAMNGNSGGNLVSVNSAVLKIILESRTKYRVRARAQLSGGNPGTYGAWTNFTTRDKRYQSPDAITELTDNTDSTAATIGRSGRRTIVVTNSSKATEVDNDAAAYNVARNWGPVTITNSDTIFNDGQLQSTGRVRLENGQRVFVQSPVAFTDRGATVVNVPAGQNSRVRYTNRGATINTTG